MKEEDYIRIIEKVNSDYLELLNSKQYTIGQKICSLKGKSIKDIIERFKRKIALRNIKETKQNENWSQDEIDSITKMKVTDKKIVIYSCITGNYDKTIEPLYKADNIDYIMFTSGDAEGWIKREIPDNIKELKNPILINRYIKFHPHELFENDYDFSIYVDGNIAIISDLSVLTNLVNDKYGFAFHRHYSRNCIYDEAKCCIAFKKGNKNKIKEQIENYKSELFPENYGLVEGNVIVNNMKNKEAKAIMEQVWEELNISQTFRDQLTIPYVLWKNKIKVEDISTLGRNVYKNPKLRIERHK